MCKYTVAHGCRGHLSRDFFDLSTLLVDGGSEADEDTTETGHSVNQTALAQKSLNGCGLQLCKRILQVLHLSREYPIWIHTI